MALNFTVRTVPHDQQRYSTVGDWRNEEDGIGEILVSNMGETDYEFLIAIHEQVEAYLCWKRGITDEAVTAFDVAYEGEGEPGDSPEAPYRKEHVFATKLERLLAEELGVNWEDYGEATSAL